MADIRINALANTATSAASDDYLALDGSANGTRKILATNVAQNVTDVTLGSAGPSVKSSLSARASRQGLVFDGTSNATIANVSAFGTGDFTVGYVGVFSALSGYQRVIGRTLTNGLYFGVKNQNPIVAIEGSAEHLTSTASLTVNKASHVVYVRQSGQGTFYVNGVAAGTGSDALNYSGAIDKIASTSEAAKSVSGIVAYNRALTAAEVVALYEAGVPADADYNTASNTSLITGDNSTFASDTGYWNKAGGATIGSGTCVLASSSQYISKASLLTVGKRYRVQLTNTSGSGNVAVYLGGGTFISTAYAASMTFEGVVSTNGTLTIATTGNVTIDTLTLFPIGVLLAPDAGQAGGGLTWYDTSGNAANITLPASGVSWNVPSSRYLGGNWTTSGNLTVSGTGGVQLNSVANLTWGGAYGANIPTIASPTGTSLAFYPAGSTSGESARFTSTGSLLLGTTTDSGNGKLQLATHTTSAGGIGFGTDWTLSRDDATNFALYATGGASATFALYLGGVKRSSIGTDGTTTYIGSRGVGYSTILMSGNGTTALTLDSSQRCILAGALRLNNAYTAGAPTATGYVTIQDSAGNTYKVLVGT